MVTPRKRGPKPSTPATRIVSAREVYGVNQRDLAARLGIYQHTLVDVEDGLLEVTGAWGKRAVDLCRAIADEREERTIPRKEELENVPA